MINKSRRLIPQVITCFYLLSFLFGCNDGFIKKEKLGLTNSDPPIDLSGVNANFYQDINYGISINNSFDLITPRSRNKTPLVIFVHDGGFVGGDKSKAYKSEYPNSNHTNIINIDIRINTIPCNVILTTFKIKLIILKDQSFNHVTDCF